MTANVDAPPATISTTVITSRAVAGPAHRGATIRLGRRSAAIVLALLGLLIVAATDQILPATSDRQAELRYWLAARATGIVALTLLALQVAFGLVLSHPHNKTTWKLSKRVFPWHDHLWVFVMAFLVVHVLSLVADPKSGGIGCRQRDAVPQCRHRFQEAHDLLRGEHERLLERLARRDDALDRVLARKGHSEEEAQCAGHLIDVGPGSLQAD